MPDNLATVRRQLDLCPKFSIIIPVYNTEKYIAKCLDSLINQDMPSRNYEIIITDDGSSDSSGEICDSYAAKYPFIHVTHTENHGPSHARNVALTQCRGEYITFCESDDYASPCLISVLSKAIEVLGRPDAIVFRHYISMNIPAEGFPVYNAQDMKSDDAEISDGEELCFRILESNKVGGFTHNKALKREIIGGIKFDESLRYCEDVDWLINIALSRKNVKVCYIDYWLYCYVLHENEGLTRDPANIYDKDGYPREFYALEKIYSRADLPPRVSEQLKALFYFTAANAGYQGYSKPRSESHARLMDYLRNYWKIYYSKSNHSLVQKAKTFVKHIFTLLHIHKPRRK